VFCVHETLTQHTLTLHKRQQRFSDSATQSPLETLTHQLGVVRQAQTDSRIVSKLSTSQAHLGPQWWHRVFQQRVKFSATRYMYYFIFCALQEATEENQTIMDDRKMQEASTACQRLQRQASSPASAHARRGLVPRSAQQACDWGTRLPMRATIAGQG
jgi:hypothetical protein